MIPRFTARFIFSHNGSVETSGIHIYYISSSAFFSESNCRSNILKLHCNSDRSVQEEQGFNHNVYVDATKGVVRPAPPRRDRIVMSEY